MEARMNEEAAAEEEVKEQEAKGWAENETVSWGFWV